jgi:hypothetical protein
VTARLDVGPAHVFDRGQRPTADEDRESGKELLLRRLEEAVAPRDRPAERSLPLVHVARPFQHVEPGREPLEQSRRRKHGRAGRGELDGERQIVEALTESPDEPVRLLGVENCSGSARTRAKELHRIVLDERGDRDHVLPRDRHRLATGRDDDHLERRANDLRHESRDRLDDVFAVVDDEQQALAGECARDRVRDLAIRLLVDVERTSGRGPDERAVPERGERDPPRAVGISVRELGR